MIFHGDGNFYDTIIESIAGDMVNIRYTKFNTYDTVRRSDLKYDYFNWILYVHLMCRIAVNTVEEQPDNGLTILPTDDKKTVNLKKKKVYFSYSHSASFLWIDDINAEGEASEGGE